MVKGAEAEVEFPDPDVGLELDMKGLEPVAEELPDENPDWLAWLSVPVISGRLKGA